MEQQNRIRSLFYAAYLTLVALFAISCSEAPTPGPIAPINPATKKTQSFSKVRPVLRKSDEASPVRPLAKGAYADEQLIALISQQPALSTGALKTLLLSESPLSAAVLMAVLNRTTKMSTGDLKAVLLASTPLPAEVEQAVQYTTLLSSGDLQTVMEAQAGHSQHFLGTTISKPMTRKAGGMLWHGGHNIKVPSDALPQDQQMFIAINPNNYVQADFGPDTWFNKPVTVTISYKNADLSGIDENSLTIAWYDETTGQWIDVGGKVDIKNKKVIVQVWHFTQYTLSTK